MTKMTITLAALIAFASPASAFKCDSGRPGSGAQCSCSGRVDCKDMRKSEMCKGSLDCKSGKCTCTAALVADPGASGRKGVPGVQPLLSAQ